MDISQGRARDVTQLAGSNTTFTIFYTFNVLPPLILFLSLNMESSPNIFFIELIVCVTEVHCYCFNYVRYIEVSLFKINLSLEVVLHKSH